MSDQLSPPRPDRDRAASDLEYALTDIESACTLLSDEDDAALARYLGRQIEDHRNAAWDAYCRIFGIDHRRDPGAVHAQDGADNSPDAALIAAHDRLSALLPRWRSGETSDAEMDALTEAAYAEIVTINNTP